MPNNYCMSIYISLLPCFIAVFIAIAYSNARKKAIKAAMEAHGYVLLQMRFSRRRFNFMPPGAPLPSIWTGPNTAFFEVTFADHNGAPTQCLAAVQIRQLGKDAQTFFDIDLLTLQPR